MASLREHAVVLSPALCVTASVAETQVADNPGLTLGGAKRVNAPGGVIAAVDDGGSLRTARLRRRHDAVPDGRRRQAHQTRMAC